MAPYRPRKRGQTDGRTTKVSQEAKHIFENIRPVAESGQDFRISVRVTEDVEKVRDRLYAYFEINNLKVSTIMLPGSLTFTRVPAPNRETQLVNMIRKLALHVDNDALYDEALALVKTI